MEVTKTQQILAKSDEAMRTIGEVALIVEVPQYVLRFWESKFKQIQPYKNKNRRYFRPEDIRLIKQIKYLLYDKGYTIKGVQNFLDNSPSIDLPLPASLIKESGDSVISLINQDPIEPVEEEYHECLIKILESLYKLQDIFDKDIT